MITIALPTTDGRLHGHFGGCREFTLLQADEEQRQIIGSRTVTPPPHAPGLFPRWLRDQGVRVVIAGGIGRRALDLFAQQGISVCAGEPGATVETLGAAYLDGLLTAAPQACTHHDHGHDHGHATD